MLGKSLEYWAVVIGMVFYVMSRDAEREPLARRAVKTVASAFLSYGLSPTLAPLTRGSEVLAALAIMAFALVLLDTITALFADREFVKDMVRRRVGGGPKDD
ncbi:hypothetical protein [Phaeobacter sp. 11ANDIMAR09]|uniref:hypothetical protein n=1 Tax=Phaeobacter sp. 11ANDIMAR09 TaxID=1225647 RepID=UPI0006C83174|nr:hypothetical protein [Phaeobacter sp. 11ANDIMAR09]KPD11550.1 hypothetical protein AN476_14995 [Phaeobacter sp. 11ANDIMAR09]